MLFSDQSMIRHPSFKKMALTVLGDRGYIDYYFRHYHGYACNLEQPETFSEKLQWLKLNGGLERLSPYVDKYRVREYVQQKIGRQHLIPLIGHYSSVDDIPFDLLPQSFVIKATHGSGWNQIVPDKDALNWNEAKQKITGWLETNYYDMTGETNYKPLIGHLVIEALLDEPKGDLKDYKFFCFNGNPILIQVDSSRFNEHKRDFYDVNWNRLDIQYRFPNSESLLPVPDQFQQLLSVSSCLSESFPFVRVDLYLHQNHVYFGELTFTPGSGFVTFTPKEYDVMLGSLLDLNRYPLDVKKMNFL